MQILKPKNERPGDFDSRYIPVKEQKVISIDRLVEQSKANKLAAKSHDFKKWEDSNGSTFDTYGQLLDYQTDKFIRRYPPNFAVSIRPELVIIKDEKMSWNREAIRLLKTENDEWYHFMRNMDISILKWGGFEGLVTDENAIKEKERILDNFAEKLNNLINENN